jgi:hypothetical protein
LAAQLQRFTMKRSENQEHGAMNPPQDPADNAIALAERDAAAAAASGAADRRPPMPEPPNVWLIAVDDVVITAPSGVEVDLDVLYVGVLKFEREEEPPRCHRALVVKPILGPDAPVVPPARAARPLPPLSAGALRGPVYRADGHRLCVEVQEPPLRRDDLRPVGIEVPSLATVEAELNRREIEHVRQRGLLPGQESILLQDAAGNWLEVAERRRL